MNPLDRLNTKQQSDNSRAYANKKLYVAFYKCPLCGRFLKYGEPKEVPYEALPDLCAQVIKNQQFLGTVFYQAPMHIPCKCPDGSCGMATFAGFKAVDANGNFV